WEGSALLPKGDDMKKLVLIIVCVPVPAPVVIEPGWELYPWVYGAPTGIGRVAISAAITGSERITDTLNGAALVAAMDLHTMAATLAMREDKAKLRSII